MISSLPLRRLIFPACVLLVALTAIAEAQTKVEPQKEETATQVTSQKKGVVRGRVLYEDNRRPLRRVEVMLSDPATRGRFLIAWTNGRGEFVVKDVPAGKYFVMVHAPGIVRQTNPYSEEAQRDLTTVSVSNNTQSEVVVRVKRGGAISGKITYADGDPVMNATIKAFLKKDGKWTAVYLGGDGTDRILTDERGVYRISGLSPGEYLVGAAEQKVGIELTAQDSPEGGNLLNRGVLPATYYNGATTLSGATALQVGAGDEVTGINVTLADRPVASISGIVTLKGENHPVSRARISLKRKDEEPGGSELEDPVTNTDEEGKFIFDEVYEGSYTLTVTPPQEHDWSRINPDAGPTKAAPMKFVTKVVELSIPGSETDNLMIEVSSGQRVSGTVTVDGNKPLPRRLGIALEPEEGKDNDYPYGLARADGTFGIEGVAAGRYYVRTSVQSTDEYYTKSVMLGQRDLIRDPLTLTANADVSNLQVVISPDVARLVGRVLTPDGKNPQRAVGVMFVSADSVGRQAAIRRMYGLTNGDGGFRVYGAPGEYLAIVMRPGEGFVQLRGDELVARTAKAQRVTLQPGDNKIEIVMPSDK